VILMAALTLVVLAGVAFRKAGAALVWYDEVASILLAWLTFYGAALAALHRGHIGFPRVMQMLPERPRRFAVVLAEIIVIGFFLLVAWGGWQVFMILGGDVLVSLPSVPRRVAQSAVPIAAILYVIAELLALATPPEEDDDDEAYPTPGSTIRAEAESP
jgi:TRAP-type C4-dicarboxylate transport system permease small subunit